MAPVACVSLAQLGHWGTGAGKCQLLGFLGDRGFLRPAREFLVSSFLARKSSKRVPKCRQALQCNDRKCRKARDPLRSLHCNADLGIAVS